MYDHTNNDSIQFLIMLYFWSSVGPGILFLRDDGVEKRLKRCFF